MKILFEAKYLYGQRTGLGEYTINMIKALMASRPQEHKLTIATDRHVEPEVTGQGLEYKVIPGRYRTQVFREQFQIPAYAALWGMDLIYSFAAPLPKYRTCKGVFTLHDVWRLKVREDNNDRYIMRYHKQSALGADVVVTVSEFSKREICELLDIDPAKVTVIYPGPSQGVVPQDRELARQIVKNCGIERPYLFTLSDLSPRKKLDLLLEAMPLVEQGYDLVVARQSKDQPELWELIHKLGLDDRVHIMGFTDFHLLNALYSAAEIFVLPSIYEGFGLPVVEAFKMSVPVVAFNVASIPEVAGDAALLVEEVSVEALAASINRLISDGDLQQELKEKGYRRLEQFSWSRAGLEAWKLISSLK